MRPHPRQPIQFSRRAGKYRQYALALISLSLGLSADAAEVVTPPSYSLKENPSVARWASGTILFRSIKDKTMRGYEDWHLTVYSDGRRSLSARENNLAMGAIRESVYVVDSAFRPISAYEQLWVSGNHRGTGFFALRGNSLRASLYREGSGQLMQDIEVSPESAIVVHSLATDGWIGAHIEKRPGAIHTVAAYVLEPWAQSAGSLVGGIKELQIEFVGTEEVTVPAGTFSTDHFRIANYKADLWISGKDRMLVRYAYLESDREYLLTRWALGTGSHNSGQ